jgi:hypothetical protein
MNAKKKSPILNTLLVLALAALACNLPGGAPTEAPTDTPAPATETATPAVSPTVDPASQECIATANQDVNMRLGPGTAWGVVGQLAGGNSARVTGHNGDRTWWQLNDSAWVSAPFTTTKGDCGGILVAGFPPAPTKKANNQNDDDDDDPPPAPSNTPAAAGTQFFPAVTFALANVAFEVDYVDAWTCGDQGRVSVILYNQGNVPIESVYYSLEYPSGTYINSGTTNNTPFKNAATEGSPGCSQSGQDSLAVGQGKYIQMYVTNVPSSGEGFLLIEACSQNFRGGSCDSQILFFQF